MIVHTNTLPEVVREAGYPINVMPAGPHNAGLVSRAVFAALKPTAFFINIGRCEAVAETALLDVLRDGRIARPELDVSATEP